MHFILRYYLKFFFKLNQKKNLHLENMQFLLFYVKIHITLYILHCHSSHVLFVMQIISTSEKITRFLKNDK